MSGSHQYHTNVVAGNDVDNERLAVQEQQVAGEYDWMLGMFDSYPDGEATVNGHEGPLDLYPTRDDSLPINAVNTLQASSVTSPSDARAHVVVHRNNHAGPIQNQAQSQSTTPASVDTPGSATAFQSETPDHEKGYICTCKRGQTLRKRHNDYVRHMKRTHPGEPYLTVDMAPFDRPRTISTTPALQHTELPTPVARTNYDQFPSPDTHPGLKRRSRASWVDSECSKGRFVPSTVQRGGPPSVSLQPERLDTGRTTPDMSSFYKPCQIPTNAIKNARDSLAVHASRKTSGKANEQSPVEEYPPPGEQPPSDDERTSAREVAYRALHMVYSMEEDPNLTEEERYSIRSMRRSSIPSLTSSIPSLTFSVTSNDYCMPSDLSLRPVFKSQTSWGGDDLKRHAVCSVSMLGMPTLRDMRDSYGE